MSSSSCNSETKTSDTVEINDVLYINPSNASTEQSANNYYHFNLSLIRERYYSFLEKRLKAVAFVNNWKYSDCVKISDCRTHEDFVRFLNLAQLDEQYQNFVLLNDPKSQDIAINFRVSEKRIQEGILFPTTIFSGEIYGTALRKYSASPYGFQFLMSLTATNRHQLIRLSKSWVDSFQNLLQTIQEPVLKQSWLKQKLFPFAASKQEVMYHVAVYQSAIEKLFLQKPTSSAEVPALNAFSHNALNVNHTTVTFLE